MSRQYWEEMIAWATSSGTAVANTTTETILFPNVTLPGNFMQDGRTIRLRVQGQWSTTTGTVTLVFKVRWGGVSGTVICTTATCTLVVSTTAAMFDLDILIVTRSNGSSGTVMGIGNATIHAGVAGTVASATGNALTTPMGSAGVLAPAVATLDLTADTPLSVTVTHGAASSSNTVTGLNYIIEALN